MRKLDDTLLANEARANFYQILEEVDGKLRQFTITLRGKAKAVIMSAEEYEGWLETLELMADKKAVERIEKSLKSKKTYTQKEVDEMLQW